MLQYSLSQFSTKIKITTTIIDVFRINDEKLLEKYKTIWTKIEDLKNIELNALPVYDDKYIKKKKNNIRR